MLFDRLWLYFPAYSLQGKGTSLDLWDLRKLINLTKEKEQKQLFARICYELAFNYAGKLNGLDWDIQRIIRGGRQNVVKYIEHILNTTLPSPACIPPQETTPTKGCYHDGKVRNRGFNHPCCRSLRIRVRDSQCYVAMDKTRIRLYALILQPRRHFANNPVRRMAEELANPSFQFTICPQCKALFATYLYRHIKEIEDSLFNFFNF